MSTPHKSDRVSLARHHQPLQPQSPFNRARDSHYEFDLDTSQFPSPSKQNGTRPRHNYRTGTLAGAYRAASRTSMSDVGIPLGSNPSPRYTRESISARSPISEASNPPEELVDVYRRIEEDGTLADFVPYDDWDVQVGTRPGSRLSRSSSKARERERDARSHEGRTLSEANLFDGTGDHSPRTARRTTDHNRDEQRLRRVTGKDSPIFSKARMGVLTALTADNLQRREEQEEQKQHVYEDDGERGPPLNLPRTWGSRATRRQEWLRNVSGSTASGSQERQEERGDPSQPKMRAEDPTATEHVRPSPRSLERSSIPVRNALRERHANLHLQEVQEGTEQMSGLDQNAPPSDGAPIPNTPIVVFKNSTVAKPGPIKRDSQDLLRRLSRTESPKLDSVVTPDPPKLFERRIYDKTPRVTGAWIDTPTTERVTEFPSDLTKDIMRSPPPKEIEEPIQQTKPAVDVQPKTEDTESRQNTNKESAFDSQPIKRSRPPLLRPKLPKSALETVIEDVRSGKENLDLGDDTIESLHAIMDDPTELKTEEEEEAAYERDVLERFKSANSNGSTSVDLDRLNNKLQSLAKNINEVKKGLNCLEEHVVLDAAIVSRPSSPKTKSQSTWHTHKNCEECVTHTDGRIYAAIPLPRLWQRDPISRRLQLTKLGWFTFVSLTWYLIECMMSEEFSHPTVSNTCDGYCLQPDAPIFPWVTVTMLWRWSHLSTLLGPLITISVAVFRLVAQLLGLWDGYVDDGSSQPGLGNIMGEIRINGTPVSFPWLSPPQQPQQPVWSPRNGAPNRLGDDQPSMDDDEYL